MKLTIENHATDEVLEHDGTESELKDWLVLNFPFLVAPPDAPVKLKFGPDEDPWEREADLYPDKEWDTSGLDKTEADDLEDPYESDGPYVGENDGA
jgi:hypothetical protein